MKNILVIITLILTLTSCSEKPKEKSEVSKMIEDTNHDVDSIEKRYDQIKTFMELGLTEEQAERSVDSINDVVKKASRGE